MRPGCLLCLVLPLAAACGPDATPAGTEVLFDLDADLTSSDHYYDLPYPSDLRLTAQGTPELSGFVNRRPVRLVEDVRKIATEHPGFEMIPVAYFQLAAAGPVLDERQVQPASATSPVLLVNVDPASPERGRLYPTVAALLPADDYTPDNLLAVAARPGFVLAPKRTYAFLVKRALGDATGAPLAPSKAMAALLGGATPDGARGAAAHALYAPLLDALSKIGVAPADLAAATVFTTGDAVAESAALTDKMLAKYSVTITGLAPGPDNNPAIQDHYCELVGKVTYPQFQRGTPPFTTQGTFDFSDGGLPARQRDEDAPITIALPNGQMPDAGYPLLVFFHGSGGHSTDVVDRGAVHVAGGPEDQGRGPAYYVAPFGIAAAGSALPLNPERLPGAANLEYLNFNNLAAFRDTFRQGQIEQRLFIEALRTLHIPPATVAACTGVSLPPGAADYHFDPDKLDAQGQSMGGMYTNLVSAIEPRIRAVVPTGAGGFWSLMILSTHAVNNVQAIVGPTLLGTDVDLSFMHPALHMLELAWEPAEPFVYMPRIARNPLPGAPVRPIYEPVGKDDLYFSTAIYDAAAIAYGNEQAGDVQWASMQDGLTLAGRGGILPYPVHQDLTSDGGAAYTGAIVQYLSDGIDDAHYIYAQRDEVKYQYSCFHSTFLSSGTATIPAPAPLGTPCPQ